MRTSWLKFAQFCRLGHLLQSSRRVLIVSPFERLSLLVHVNSLSTVPEVQGTTQEVAREKCRRAAELVSGVLFR